MLNNLSRNNMVKSILDHSRDMNDVITEVLSWWDIDIYSRKPRINYFEDIKSTDLDMSTMLFALTKRNAVIKFPNYTPNTQVKKREGMELTSDKNRHGKLVNVFSNQKVFSFGVRFVDVNIMSPSDIGDYRNFLVLDYDGDWYSGWNYIDFMPTNEEKEFINQLKNNNNTIYFDHFVHPNRWSSFYGKYYLITKMLLDRLDEEARDYNRQIKNMILNNIQPLDEEEKSDVPYVPEGEEDTIPKKFKSMEVELITPDKIGEFPQYEHNAENLTFLIRKKSLIRNKIIPRLRFNTRATELAFFTYGYNNNEEKMAGWINDEWEHNFRRYREKKRWDKLNLPQSNGDEISILKRNHEVTMRVRNRQQNTEEETV